MKITQWTGVTTTHGTVLKGHSAGEARTTDFHITLPGTYTGNNTQLYKYVDTVFVPLPGNPPFDVTRKPALCRYPETRPSFSFPRAANEHSHRAVLTVTVAFCLLDLTRSSNVPHPLHGLDQHCLLPGWPEPQAPSTSVLPSTQILVPTEITTLVRWQSLKCMSYMHAHTHIWCESWDRLFERKRGASERGRGVIRG